MTDTEKKYRVAGGIYLVVDPSMPKEKLLAKLEQALRGGVDVVQIWNHWPEPFEQSDKKQLIFEILSIAKEYDVPVLINEEWKLLQSTELHGVHFDSIPEHFENIRLGIGREFIAGITCGNNLDVIRWADQNGAHYISFCSMFPSASVDSCEIVRPETVRQARKITNLPLFISGGITPENLSDVGSIGFNGVALISGILASDQPKKSTERYKQILKNLRP